MSGALSLIRVPALAFLGGFLVVGSWIWGPQLWKQGFSWGTSSSSFSSGGSWFGDANRIGRPEVAPVLRSCVTRMLDLGRTANVDPGAVYSMLKAGSLQVSLSTLAGGPNALTGNRTTKMAAIWGELASCIYAQDDRELCDPDNRAAMVEASTKFFAFAKQAETSRPPISGSDAQVLSNFTDRLLNALKNHRHYGTLVSADFGNFPPSEIARIMEQEKQTSDICRRR